MSPNLSDLYLGYKQNSKGEEKNLAAALPVIMLDCN